MIPRKLVWYAIMAAKISHAHLTLREGCCDELDHFGKLLTQFTFCAACSLYLRILMLIPEVNI